MSFNHFFYLSVSNLAIFPIHAPATRGTFRMCDSDARAGLYQPQCYLQHSELAKAWGETQPPLSLRFFTMH